MLGENGIARSVVTQDDSHEKWGGMVVRETTPLEFATSVVTVLTAQMWIEPIVLYKGDVVAQATAIANTAAATPSRQWFALYSPAGALLGQTPDAGALAWAAGTARKRAFNAPLTITADGVYFIVFYMVAGTMPALVAPPGLSSSAWQASLMAAFPLMKYPTARFSALASTATAPAVLPAGSAIGTKPWIALTPS